MTIGTSNISMSSIASEKGIGASNLSLGSLSSAEVKTNLADGTSASSQYGLVKHTMNYGGYNSQREAGTVTSAQGTGSAGLNTASHSMSEWGGYDPGSVPGKWQMGSTGTSGVVYAFDEVSNDACQISVSTGLQIWCTKVSGVIYIYGAPRSGLGQSVTHRNNGATTYTSSTTQLGTIGTSGGTSMVPTGCTMSYTTTQASSGGAQGFLGHGGSVATISGGSNSTTNLGSTKIGYNVYQSAVSERYSSGTATANFGVGVRFNWTFPSSPGGGSYNSSYTEIRVACRVSADHDWGWNQNPC
jgi:hypothetical protein